VTTDQKIEHIRWYIKYRNSSKTPEMQNYYKDLGTGAAGAWFADMTISHDTYNQLIYELKKEITQ